MGNDADGKFGVASAAGIAAREAANGVVSASILSHTESAGEFGPTVCRPGGETRTPTGTGQTGRNRNLRIPQSNTCRRDGEEGCFETPVNRQLSGMAAVARELEASAVPAPDWENETEREPGRSN